MLSSIRSDPWWQPPNDGLQLRQRERIVAQRLAAYQRRDARAATEAGLNPAAAPFVPTGAAQGAEAYRTLLFMVNCVQAHLSDAENMDTQVRNANRGHVDDWHDDWQDEGEAMADVRAVENPATDDAPPTEQDERAAVGGLSQDLRDRIERNRAVAIQRKIDRRVYGPIAPNFSAAKSYDGLSENRVYKRGPDGLGYYIDARPIQQVVLSELLYPLEVAPPLPLELSKLVGDDPKHKHQRPFTVPTPNRRINGRGSKEY